MTEHYISFEQAAKLKELGFDKKVNHGYSQKMRIEPDLSYGTPKEVHSKDPKNYNDNRKGAGKGIQFYSAPRLDQAQAWLREVKGIHIAVDPYCKENNSDTNICNAEDCFWSMELSSVPFGYWLNVSKGEFDTYELALSDGISGALDLLTNRLNEK